MKGKRQSDSQKRFAFASRLFAEEASSEIPSEIQVLPCGEWNHASYGPMKIAPADIAEMKKNFDDGVRLDVPITAGHDNGMSGGELPAVAWFTELIDKGYEGLWAKVQFNERGKAHLLGREFKYFSAEFFATYSNPTDGHVYKNVLSGGALTNNPFFKEMQPVAAFSEKGIFSHDFNNEQNDMLILENVVKMSLSEMTQEHKDFLIANKAQLTAEQKVAFKEIVGEDAPAPTAPVAPVETPVATNEVKISASEFAQLQNDAKRGREAAEQLEASEQAAIVSSLMASQTNAAGRFAEAQRASVETFVKTLTAAQRNTFAEIVKAIPSNLTFGEIGDGGSPTNDAQAIADKIDTEVKAVMASDKNLSQLEAMNRVFAEKPDLKKQYDASLRA
jgi:phage I-like protein